MNVGFLVNKNTGNQTIEVISEPITIPRSMYLWLFMLLPFYIDTRIPFRIGQFDYLKNWRRLPLMLIHHCWKFMVEKRTQPLFTWVRKQRKNISQNILLEGWESIFRRRTFRTFGGWSNQEGVFIVCISWADYFISILKIVRYFTCFSYIA